MDFSEVVRRRHMTRTYLTRPVPEELVQRVLDAGLRAPSAGFSQGWAFVVLSGADQTGRFWALTSTGGDPPTGGRRAAMRTAPVVIIPLASKQAYLDRYAEPDKRGLGMESEDNWPVPYWDIDTAFATMSMLLAATDLGLGALFFGIFHGERALMDDLGVPPGLRPIGAMLLGYPAPTDVRSPSLDRGRRPTDSVIHRGRWSSTPPTASADHPGAAPTG
jgi:nitroreductase